MSEEATREMTNKTDLAGEWIKLGGVLYGFAAVVALLAICAVCWMTFVDSVCGVDMSGISPGLRIVHGFGYMLGGAIFLLILRPSSSKTKNN